MSLPLAPGGRCIDLTGGTLHPFAVSTLEALWNMRRRMRQCGTVGLQNDTALAARRAEWTMIDDDEGSALMAKHRTSNLDSGAEFGCGPMMPRQMTPDATAHLKRTTTAEEPQHGHHNVGSVSTTRSTVDTDFQRTECGKATRKCRACGPSLSENGIDQIEYHHTLDSRTLSAMCRLDITCFAFVALDQYPPMGSEQPFAASEQQAKK
ncbi:hypothetical protein CERZMDRAFT_84808 [Cercospora zeae-maydis SCOH1-5]|uniref:Uncharacterized protein n=1 Tax=Cercospora zeae-maydis SCOH1-5 TaxID=717836 RepID=A0A6A6FGA9_9PEZI|nr:hypothetical protein CERZMDRAFT_84808 [Cercospora zeae-maydis SCOH1-5]